VKKKLKFNTLILITYWSTLLC